MNTFTFLMRNFFRHKDFLPDASQIPGTIYTPMQIFFELLLLIIIIFGAVYLSKNQRSIKPVLTALFIALIVFEVLIDIWDSVAGINNAFDASLVLPLYPCSIFMYTLPFVIWGRGVLKEIACGYICTLGLVGALINFIYPIARLADYSCISFPAFHTFFYHGSMLFTALLIIISGIHSMHRLSAWWTPFLASVPGLLISIPANIINYSTIKSDYMYFTGQHPLSRLVFGDTANMKSVTVIMYLVYLFGPAIFYYIPWITVKLLEKFRNSRPITAKKV